MAQALPEGFVLDEPQTSELPEGFTVDTVATTVTQPSQVVTPPVAPARPSMTDMFARYTNGEFDPSQMEAFEELARRQFAGGTMGISEGQPFKQLVSAAPQDQTIPSGEDVTLRELVEPVATLATGAIAEPLAGIAGIAAGLVPGEEGQAERAVEATREALTYMPKTERGQEILSEVGGLMKPVAEFVGGLEKKFGDTVFDATGSPTLAAAATTIPTVIAETIGLAGGREVVRTTRRVKKRLKEGNIMREIDEAAPTIDKLKETSRGVFKEIDEMGVSVDKGAYSGLVNEIGADLRTSGLDPDITPSAQKALTRLEAVIDEDVSLSGLDTLREVARGAASSLNPKESMLGVKIIEKIDDFLDQADRTSLNVPAHIDNANVGKRYRVARDMWGRARKSELIQESFEKARNQASGFENGIRTQFRAILNNKKKSRFFNREELNAIKKVVRGDKKQNIANLIGRLGFSEGGATNVLGGAVGMGAGATVAGAPGAVIVPIIGQLSRKLAQRMTVAGAEFADQVIRAGSNAKKITEAYLKNTPKELRSSRELSELLTRNDIDLVDLPVSDIVNEAVSLVNERRAELAGAITAATDTQREVENE